MIDKLICPHRVPSEDEWLIYYYKQARPTATVEEIFQTLGYSRRKIRNTLMSLKSHPSRPLRFGYDVIEKIEEYMEQEDDPGESIIHFVNALNFCPAWPDWEDEKMAELLMQIDDELLSFEMQVYKHTLRVIYDQDESMMNILQNLDELRELFRERGLYLLYWTVSVPVAYLSAILGMRFSREEYRILRKIVPHIPYFYRWFFDRVKPFVDMVRGELVQVSFDKFIREIDDGVLKEFLENMTEGHYEKALELVPLMKDIPYGMGEILDIVITNIRILTSPVPPPYPEANPEGVSTLVWFNRLLSRLLLARLKEVDPMEVLEGIPEEVMSTIRRLYLEPDIHFLKDTEIYSSQIIRMLVEGKVDEAWKIARRNGLVYDFHMNYILLGLPVVDLLRKYRLRIGWYPISIEFRDNVAFIHYGNHAFHLPPTVSHLLRDVVRGKGYFSDRAYRKFRKYLWFLKIRRSRKNGMNLVMLDEDIPIVEERI